MREDPPTVPIRRLRPQPEREPPQFIRREPSYRPAPRRRPAPVAPRPAPVSVAPRPRRAVRRRGGVFRRIMLVALAFGIIVGTATVTTAIWVELNLRRVTAFADYPDRPVGGSGTNWLLVGSDNRGDLTPEQQAELSTGGDLGSGRTDTILLVHIPVVTSRQPTTMVSIPRDSYVDIPGWGMDKINAAFAEGGAPLLTQTVESATGLRVDHYAEIGFGGFGDVVDALGGVRMCLAEPVDDPLAGISLPAGCQLLDGAGALGYVRSRATPRADLDRMQHQREFMSTLLARSSSPSVWLNPWRWYSVPHAAVGALTVDTGTHVWDLALLGWSLHTATTTVTVPIGEFAGNESGAVVVWDSTAATALFDALRADRPIPAEVLDSQP